MYDPEYFPTPQPVTERMLAPYLIKTGMGRYDASALDGMRILDPSAGSGALLKAVEHLYRGENKPELHAIEVNPDMQPTLREKFLFVHEDFLTFETDVRYDLILMNPPFSNGDAHLAKAWEVMKHGDIVCLLNAETLKNPYTTRRQWLAKLIEDHGSVEHLGPVFKNSQRPTDVEVALVRLKKVSDQEGFDFWEEEAFEPQETDFAFTEENMANMPAVNDVIAAMIHQYQLSQRAFVDYLKAYKRLLYHAKPLVFDPAHSVDKITSEAVRQHTGKGAYNTFVTLLQQEAWDSIFKRTKLHDLMSTKVRTDFEKMKKDQGGIPLTEANIRGLLEMLFMNRGTILAKCVEEAFDIMTSYSDSNRTHWEGWRTNNAYKVNRKVIIPGWAVRYECGSWRTAYYGYDKWLDIDRACAALEGKLLSSPSAMAIPPSPRPYQSSERKVVTIADALSDRFHELNNMSSGKYKHYRDNVCESEYFHLKFWKKGTVHLVFKDALMWQRFNQAAAQGKNWVGYDTDHVPTPTADAADDRYAKRLAEINRENRKLMIAG